MKFKYNGRIYNPVNVEKKLKKMGITLDDIEIILEEKENIEYNDIKLYHFKNKITGETIRSVYDNLNNLCNIINIHEWYKE